MASRREKEKEFKQQLIADAALQLFQSGSYESTTVEDIARLAEVGKGTIYQYFESKNHILLYILCRGVDELTGEIRVKCLDAGETADAFSSYLSLQYRFFVTYHHLFLYLLQRKLDGSLNAELFRELKDRMDQKNAVVAQLLNRGIERGILIDSDPMKLARAVENVVKGFSIQRMEHSVDETDPEKDLELIKTILIRGLSKNDGGAAR